MISFRRTRQGETSKRQQAHSKCKRQGLLQVKGKRTRDAKKETDNAIACICLTSTSRRLRFYFICGLMITDAYLDLLVPSMQVTDQRLLGAKSVRRRRGTISVMAGRTLVY